MKMYKRGKIGRKEGREMCSPDGRYGEMAGWACKTTTVKARKLTLNTHSLTGQARIAEQMRTVLARLTVNDQYLDYQAQHYEHLRNVPVKVKRERDSLENLAKREP